MIFANKQDLPSSLSQDEIRKVFQLIQLFDLDSITTHHWAIFGCSGVTGKNLLNGIDWVITDIGSRLYSLD